MTRAALDIVLNDPERYVLTDDERSAYERLAVFYGTAAVDPSRFPLSPKQAARIKAVVKKAKGPAQPKSLRNKRKQRQLKRRAFHKQRRKNNREFMAEYNEAMAQLHKEQEEAEAAYAEVAERIANEPKFAIYSGDGQLIMEGIPESAIKPMEDPVEDAPMFGAQPQLILPGDLPTE